MKKITILVLITVFGFFLRIYLINQNPPSLNWDEVSHGYNAYSILKTGHDEWGQSFPLANFRAYGDYPLPLNLYFTMPSIAIFGLNETGIRLPHVILGSLLILICFFIVQEVTGNLAASLLAALLVAVDPWTLFPSRFVAQSNLGVFFVAIGILFFLLREKKKIFLPLSALALGLSAYSYHNTRILAPLLILSILIIFKDEWFVWLKQKRKYFLSSLILIFIFFAPLIPILLNPEARARASWVSILDQGAINRINENRGHSKLPQPFPRLIYNKATYFTFTFVVNYFGYFDPRFLFQTGGSQYQFSVPGFGVLYPIEFPFFYFGLVLLIKQAIFKRNKNYLLFLTWLILAPIPAAITSGADHVIRATTILPLPQILTGIGLAKFMDMFGAKRKTWLKLFMAAVMGVLAVSLVNYLTVYFGSYRINYSQSWQYGYKEAAADVRINYDNYNQIWVTKKYGEPHEFLYFWLGWDPEKLQNDPSLVRYFQTNWYWTDAFDKFRFFNDWEVIERVKEPFDCVYTEQSECTQGKQESKILLITSPGNYPEGWKLLETINFLDGKPAFDILEK